MALKFISPQDTQDRLENKAHFCLRERWLRYPASKSYRLQNPYDFLFGRKPGEWAAQCMVEKPSEWTRITLSKSRVWHLCIMMQPSLRQTNSPQSFKKLIKRSEELVGELSKLFGISSVNPDAMALLHLDGFLADLSDKDVDSEIIVHEARSRQ